MTSTPQSTWFRLRSGVLRLAGRQSGSVPAPASPFFCRHLKLLSMHSVQKLTWNFLRALFNKLTGIHHMENAHDCLNCCHAFSFSIFQRRGGTPDALWQTTRLRSPSSRENCSATWILNYYHSNLSHASYVVASMGRNAPGRWFQQESCSPNILVFKVWSKSPPAIIVGNWIRGSFLL